MPINIIALLFCFVTVLFSFFPLAVPVNAITMNWSCLLYGGTNIFAVLFYFLVGKYRYDGPVVEVEVEHGGEIQEM